MYSYDSKSSGKILINKGIKKLMEKRTAELNALPNKSKFYQEPLQPAFKYHMESLNPPLPLGDGTRNLMNSQISGIRRHRMDELESVTTRENGSMLMGINEANPSLLDTIKENDRQRLSSEVYNKMKTANTKRKRTMTLPVHDYEDAILKDIDNNQTLVIQGSTGCGKSTQIPQFILDQAARRDQPVHIVVTQPRRIAAISLATHVASERGWEVGSYVGYQVGLDKKCSRETVINYVTTGVLLELLIHNKTLADFTHVVLDEVHERDVDMDLLLSVVKELLMHDQKTKVILMSATVVAEKFSCYFSKQFDPVTHECLPGPVFRIGGKMFPVEEFFLDDMPNLGICQDAKLFEDISTTPRLTSELKEIIYQLLMYITQKEINESRCQDISKLDMGSVLIFLPGLNEITELNEYLMMGPFRESCVNPKRRDLFAARGKSTPIFPLRISSQSVIAKVLSDQQIQKKYQDTFYLLALHSSIGISQQRRAFDNPQTGRRKIILSTNIAESSITVKDIKYVIDLCMIKRLRYDRETHFTSLQTEWTSKSSCKQRSGRAGRVRNGHVYRLIGQSVFDQLDDYCPPEILTGPLTQVVLRIKEFGREPRMLLQRAMDCPSLEDIGYTFLALKEAGALCINRKEVKRDVKDSDGNDYKLTQILMPTEDHWQGNLTFIGRFISSLPMDLHMGKLIALGYAFDVLEESIIVAACLTVSRSIFLQPIVTGHVRSTRNMISPNQTRILDAFEKKLRLSEGKNSDLLTMLNAFKLWYQRTKTGAFRSRADERKWCEDLFLDGQALKEVEVLIEEIRRRLKERFNILVSDFKTIDKTTEENEAFLLPNDNKLGTLHTESFKKSFRNILLQMAIAGAFYPNYFLRTHNPFSEDDAMRTFDGINPFQCVEIGNLPMDEGNLYKHSISEHFHKYCMKYSRDQPTVICRNTKAIIKFPSNPSNTLKNDSNFETNLSVILALRMGQLSSLKPKIRIYELNTEEKCLVKQITDTELIKKNQILPLNYKYVSSHKSFIGFPNVECNYIRVYVSYAAECGSFYGIYEDEKHQEQNLWSEIYEYASNRKNKLVLKSPVLGDVVLAPYEGEFYRAEIISFNDDKVTVFFVDYGNFAVVSINEIEKIPDYIRNYCPFLAVKFVLSEIKPLAASHPNNKWSDYDRCKFLEYILSYTSTPLGCRVYSVVENAIRVRVELLNDQNKILNEELIHLGIAERVEESYMSRKDNLKRTRCNNLRHIDLFADNALSTEKLMQQVSLDDDSDSNSESNNSGPRYDTIINDAIQRHAREEMITLSSPHHPFLMKFHGLTESCRRPVSIAPESVNCILIEPEPQNHLTRLITAACVQSHISGGDGGSDLMLRHTTMLPYIPGLPFIIALIFTPYAELMADKHRTRYIGARCGLGYDSEGRSLHPANDLEIKADVRFDESDLRSINGIRGMLNLSLGNTTHSQDVMDKYQCGIKKFLTNLFNSNRDLVNNDGIEEFSNSMLFNNEKENLDVSRAVSNETMNNSDNTDINRIFINHVQIDGVCRRKEWVMVPVLGNSKTERSKNDWIRRYVKAAEDNLKELNLPLMPMARVKMSRDVLPYVKICEICIWGTGNNIHLNNTSTTPCKGVSLYTESDLDAHLKSQQHKQSVQELNNILNV